MPTRDYLQSLCPFHGPNRLFFLLPLLVLSIIWTLYRGGSLCHALRILWTHFFITLKTQRAVKELHLEKDDKSEMMYRTYSKQEIRLRSWLVFFGILIGLFTLLCFHKLYVQQIPLSIFLEKLFQTDILIPLLVSGLSIAAIFGTLTYGFLSLQEEKTPKKTKQKEKSNQ